MSAAGPAAHEHVDDDGGGGALARVAQRLRLTEGQLYTYAIGITVALLAAAGALPPALGHRYAPPVAVAAAPSPSAFSPAPFLNPVSAAPPGAPALAGSAQWPSEAGRQPVVDTTASAAPPPGADSGQESVVVLARVGSPGAPEGIVVAKDGSVWVATNNAAKRGDSGPSKLLRYSSTGQLEQTLTVVGQPADRTAGLTGIALNATGAVLALDGSTGRVLQFDAAGVQSTVVTLPNLPTCGAVVVVPACEPGSTDNAALPRAVAADAAGDLYVSDAGQATIWRISASLSVAQPWHQDAAYRATNALAGLALDKAGNVVFAAGSIYRLSVDATGSPGARAELAKLGDNDGAAGLALGPDGSLYVALAKANQLLVLAADGAVRQRVSSAANEDVPFDTPVGVTVNGDSVLVTNQSAAANDRNHWAVLKLKASS